VVAVATLLVVAVITLAEGDVPYAVRVLSRGDANTSDYTWKATQRIVADSPVAWREHDECAQVTAAFSGVGVPSMNEYLAEGAAQSLVVIHHGQLVCQWYGNGGAADRPAMAFSVSKSVLALLVARAVDARLMNLDDPITAYVPELGERDPRFAEITIRALLDMRSGIGFSQQVDFPWVNQDASAVYYSSDLVETVLTRPQIVSPPGPFQYNDYAPNLVGLALQRATGTTLTDGPVSDLWHAIGAQDDAWWCVDGHGFAWHESGLVSTARDLARIGQLYLDEGLVSGDLVAPSAYITTGLSGSHADPVVDFGGIPMGYENGWWRLPGPSGGADLAAMGNFGQVMVVSPASDVVIVRLGTDEVRESNASIAARLALVADALSK